VCLFSFMNVIQWVMWRSHFPLQLPILRGCQPLLLQAITSNDTFHIFNFNLFCIHLIHRGYDPLDMELVNTENKVTNIIHNVRYNTVNFRIYVNWRHSDCNVTVESYISYGV
jgi:hypothetical protein